MDQKTKTVVIITAHPDDETLWAGGTILYHPSWICFIICLCRKSDPDRAPKFEKALKVLNADGIMGDVDDGPDQIPLGEEDVENAILQLMPRWNFDLVITHSINGEYTRHRRHEEIGKAVINIWKKGHLTTKELWAFAYEDNHHAYYPVVMEDAPIYLPLPHDIWEKKYDIITSVYGFEKDSWEAQTTPKEEAFWQFFTARQAHQWLVSGTYTL
ncbi:MAG TPA: PIG-L family deacetylase [Mucilaginibacter sp.]|jgi:LmbE family N-acetylglucosaminyl deacetylase